jgi:hypothetical protein
MGPSILSGKCSAQGSGAELTECAGVRRDKKLPKYDNGLRAA